MKLHKNTARAWAKKLHPDLGGNAEEFKVMQAEYEKLWERLKNVHQNAQGETYTKETTETPQEFINIINTLVRGGLVALGELGVLLILGIPFCILLNKQGKKMGIVLD